MSDHDLFASHAEGHETSDYEQGREGSEYSDQDGTGHHLDEDLTAAIRLGGGGDDAYQYLLHVDPLEIDDAIHLAAERADFDPQADVLCSGWLNDLQGITAEYLVADALNNSGDGLSYHLYTDLSHPDVDIAGVAADGSIVRLLQVKATSSPDYAETGRHPNVELVATRDGAGPGMLELDYSSAQLRSEIDQLLST